MSSRKQHISDRPGPSKPMQAMAAVFAKAAEQESGPEKAYLRTVAMKALKSASD